MKSKKSTFTLGSIYVTRVSDVTNSLFATSAVFQYPFLCV